VFQSLGVVSGERVVRGDTEPGRTVGRLVSDLTYLDRLTLGAAGLREFLSLSLQRCGLIGQLLQQQYSLQ
jgi:hypothetical protein